MALDFESTQLGRAALDQRIPSAVFDGPQVGKVVSATATTAMVTFASFNVGINFGPAPYPRPALHQITLAGTTPAAHQHDPGLPPAGTACLVLFVGPGVDQPYIVAFYSWPLT